MLHFRCLFYSPALCCIVLVLVCFFKAPVCPTAQDVNTANKPGRRAMSFLTPTHDFWVKWKAPKDPGDTTAGGTREVAADETNRIFMRDNVLEKTLWEEDNQGRTRGTTLDTGLHQITIRVEEDRLGLKTPAFCFLKSISSLPESILHWGISW